jgi:alkanesulfonate monooxygenase SsuD/methylene tetrahydromethanopterin reductase-like flavin-dependent oxidoreductase (luciferase family)
MTEFYDEIKGRMRTFDRRPEECKIFFTCNPTIAETEQAALQQREALAASASLEAGLAKLATTLAVDLSSFDLDQPLPPMEIQGIRGKQEQYYAHGRQPTIREMAIHSAMRDVYPIWGTPEQVADKLEEMMDAAGGDGVAIRTGPTPATISRFVDGVVPILQRRGRVRTEYTGTTLREHLMEF